MNYNEILREVTENLRRDEQKKAAIAAQFPNIGFAMDAATFAELSARELAGLALEGCGLKLPRGADPLEALAFYTLGRRQAQQLAFGVRSAALDGAESGSVVGRYINGGNET